ncbi:FAD-dependent oxidoreductase [bacterium]|nr:FAD-dependent oxidoreductase [bacterium]
MNTKLEIVPIETDVLVIGGGLAGCMAAIKAREHDVKVVIAEKGNTASSGQAGSGLDHLWAYIPPVHGKMGWKIEDLVEDHMQGVAHGFADRELLHLIARESYNRMLDLESYGVNFRYEDSKIPGKFRIVHQFHSIPSSFNFDGERIKPRLARAVKKTGVEVVHRVMMTDLLTVDGQITGALGVGIRNASIYYFQARSVILCCGGKTGRLSREHSSVYFNLHLPGNLSADAKAMALRAGLPIMNTEFLCPRRYCLANYETAGRPPRNSWFPAAAIVNAKGETVVPKTTFFDWGDLEKGYQIDPEECRRQWIAGGAISPPGLPSAKELEEAGPFYVDCTGAPEEEIRYVEWSNWNEGKCRQLMRHLKEEGIDLRRDKLELGLGVRELGNLAATGLVVDHDLETEIKGLFAAGDDVGAVPFGAATAAVTMGWYAGDMAGRRAKRDKAALPEHKSQTEALLGLCADILSAKDGCRWLEAEIALQNVVDKYCGNVRTEDMLEAGLDRLHYIRNVEFYASSPHDLSRCLEVMSLLENAEMLFRTSLARKESRAIPFKFFRADFPDQNDKEWFAFSTIRLKKDEYEISKIPVKG